MNISINDIKIQDLLPQKPPFVMVDRLVSSDDTYSVSELEINDGNVFVEDNRMMASGLVENIAQTCAAGIGFRNLQADGKIKLGVIGAVNTLDIKRLPHVGEIITTKVKFVEEVFQMTLFEATIKCGEEEIATATIKTALTDIDANT